MQWVGDAQEIVEERVVEQQQKIELANDENQIEDSNETDALEDAAAIEMISKVILIPKGKLSLLHAVGVNTERSTLVNVRKYFHSNTGAAVSQKQLNDLRNHEQDYLHNTVLWLQSEATVFTSEDERLFWLRKLYNTLPKLTQNTPLPYIVKTAGVPQEPTFEYKVENHADKELYYFDSKQQRQL